MIPALPHHPPTIAGVWPRSCELVAEGALGILVGLMDDRGGGFAATGTLLRSAARALANISASARHGTWQGDAIGSAIFQVSEYTSIGAATITKEQLSVWALVVYGRAIPAITRAIVWVLTCALRAVLFSSLSTTRWSR
jgi:hypothetical protein